MHFLFFHFYNFLTSFVKNLMKKPPVFIRDIKSCHKLLFSCKDLRPRNFWQRKNGPLKFFENLRGDAFLLLIFIKWKNYCNVLFTDTYKLPYWHLLHWKANLCKTAVFKLRAVQSGVSFFLCFLLLLVLAALLSKTLWKNFHFLMQIFEIQFNI